MIVHKMGGRYYFDLFYTSMFEIFLMAFFGFVMLVENIIPIAVLLFVIAAILIKSMNKQSPAPNMYAVSIVSYIKSWSIVVVLTAVNVIFIIVITGHEVAWTTIFG